MGTAKPEYRDSISDLRDPTMPVKKTMSLRRQRQSLYATVMRKAWAEAGESLEEAGEVTQYLDRRSGCMVMEFDGSRSVKQLHRPDDDVLVIEFDSDG